MPEQRQQNDHRDRRAEQPQQSASPKTHHSLLGFSVRFGPVRNNVPEGKGFRDASWSGLGRLEGRARAGAEKSA